MRVTDLDDGRRDLLAFLAAAIDGDQEGVLAIARNSDQGALLGACADLLIGHLREEDGISPLQWVRGHQAALLAERGRG